MKVIWFCLQKAIGGSYLKQNKYLLLAEFLVRTGNYGPSFFPSIYSAQARLGHKSMEKTRIRNLQYGPKKRG